MKIIKDLGFRFATDKSKKKSRFALCICPVCEKEVEVNYYNVKNGISKKCRSCASMQSNATHKKTNTRLYSIWSNMKQRCTNPKLPRYKDYGLRGITVCREWLEDFNYFYEWAMKNGYDDNLTIDRINNDGNYEPSNCRWITNKEQQLNKRVKISRVNKNYYRGVRKVGNKYEARKTVNKVYISIGTYNTIEEARLAFLEFESNLEQQIINFM